MSLSTLTTKDKEVVSKIIWDECVKARHISANLLQTAKVACMIETLTILACCTKDPSLKSGDPNEKFLYLRTPDSFKASLYQVINALCDAFRTGHNSIDKIQRNLNEMPSLMNDILEAMEMLSDPDSKDMIDYALETIKLISDKCVDAAKEAHDECVKALEVIRELSQAALATQGRKERRQDEVDQELVKQKAEEEQRTKALKEMKEKIEIQQKIVDETMEDYKDKMKKSSDLTLVITTMLIDNVSSIIQSATSSVQNLSSFVGNIPSDILRNAQNRVFSVTKLKKDGIEAQAMEIAFLSVLEDIVQTGESELTPENISDHVSHLKILLDYKFSTETGKILRESAKKLYEAFGESDTLALRKEAIVHAKIAIKTYKNIYQIQHEAENREMLKENQRSQERQTLMQTQQKNLEVARDTMKDERRLAEELRKEQNAADEKLNEVMNNLAKLKMDEVDLKDVIYYLQQGIRQLTQVQVAWQNIVAFFNHIKNTVDGPLIMHINGFTKKVEQICDKKDAIKANAVQRRILAREVTKACAFGNILMQSTELYKNISTKHVMPVINKSITNMSLTREEAKQRQYDIMSNFNKIKSDTQNTIEDHNDQLSCNVYAALKAQGFDVKAAMTEKKEEEFL